MNPKIKKIDAEYEKNAAKITELQERQKELEKQRLELENTDIIGIVRSMGLTPDQLAALIQSSRTTAPAADPERKEGTNLRKSKFHILAILLATMMVLTVLTAFAAPALAWSGDTGISIQITPPTGWTNRDASVAFTITDNAGDGFERVMVKGEGNWRDITAVLEQEESRYNGVLAVSDNCTVTVSVTGWDGQTYEESRYIDCFDREAPAVRTSFTAKHLHVEATDTASGVAAVYVDGHKYTALTNGAVDVPLTEIGASAAKISVQAEDNVGNRSQAVATANPNYKSAVSEPETPPEPVQTTPSVTIKPVTGTTSPSTSGSNITPAAPKEPEAESGTSTALTPEGNMSLSDDISGAASDEKQFITVTTKNGNYFYLIIDRAEDGENTVHFLNQVDEADLLALMEDGTVTSAVCSCTDKCKAGAVNTSCELCAVDMTECVGKEAPPEPDPEPDPDPDPEPEPEPKKDNTNGLLVVVLAVALAGGGAVYFLKFKKNKPDTKGSADLDDYDYGDEDETEDEDA